MRRYGYMFWLMILIAGTARGQNASVISGHFKGYSFDRFVKEIRSQVPYRIYYDPAETDSLVLDIDVESEKLDKVLDRIFSGTDFHYSFAGGDRIFITRHVRINPELSAYYFDSTRPQITDTAAPEIPEIITAVSTARSALENRVFEFGSRNSKGTGKVTLGGYVRDEKTGEPIPGASISTGNNAVSLGTDQFGFYSLTLPRGRYILRISSAGMKETRRQVLLNADGRLNVELEEFVSSLRTVTVSAEKVSNTRSVQMGVNRLNIQAIRQVPVIFGEADILKVVLTLPGVTSVGEAANGFNVRGGAADQNLILFNDATIYNPSHLFGFFSAFDPDVVKGIELYKSAIPEKYGGRLSSVLDVSVKDGNAKKWSGSGGLGLLTSRFTIEGPIKKDKTTLVAGVRTTYSDWLLNLVPKSSFSNSKANFYDASIHLTHVMNARNTFYLTGYLSSDRFTLNKDTTYKYANRNANLKWKHNFNNKLYSILTAGIDHYQYSVASSSVPVNAYNLAFDINQDYFRADFSFTPGPKHVISYGLNTIYYKLHPGDYSPQGDKSLVLNNKVPSEQALESALYLGDQYSVTSNLTLSAGLRYSIYNYLGPHKVNEYVPGLPREEATLQDSVLYGKGKLIKTYSAPEIRLSARYSFSANTSLKASFNTTQQYIHSISNTTSISPTDIWKLSDPNVKPQQGAQLSLGLYQNFNSGNIETSVEVYYKKIRDHLDYKSGANLVLNPHLETDVFETKGKAYGVEFLVKKNTGKLNGWLSYTWSRTFLRQDDPLAGELVNKGDYYPASFDKPHNVNFVGNYRFSHRYSTSVNVVYSTGRPITLPLAIYSTGGSAGLYYSDRNAYRIPDYFRTDLSFTMEGNSNVRKSTHNSWSIGVYNLTGRQNAYSVYFVQENGKVKGYQLSIFGTLIPFITFNIKF